MSPHMLQQFSRLTEFLGRLLGPDYEVALHDLATPDHSIVAIANNHISGREIGTPLDGTAKSLVSDHSYLTSDYHLHYRGLSINGKMLRSSSFFLKDEVGALVGLLCINFDDSRYQSVVDSILKLCHPDAFVETNFIFDTNRIPNPQLILEETPLAKVPQGTVFTEINSILTAKNITADRLTQEEKLEIVRILRDRGIFLLKGAVKDVAVALYSSPATIYRYLTQLRNKPS